MILSVFIFTFSSFVLCVHMRSIHHDHPSQFFNDNYDPTMLEELDSLMSVYKQEFQDFKERHTKVYQSEEEENSRFLNFISSLLQVNSHNKLYQKGHKTYEMRINHMSDWTAEELSKITLLKISNTTGSQYISPNIKIDLPESFDWREKGAVTEVKNQLYCGSCFAFSATGSLEGQIWRKTGKLISLSEQQIVDCDKVDDNCNGGFVQDAFNYIKVNGGIETEKDYPYVSGETQLPNSKCYFDKTKVSATETGFVQLPPRDEEKLKEALVSVGPISIAISATESFKRYSGGIFHDAECDNHYINHAVLLVGYGTDEVTGIRYWIIKNSWGTLWGENGYVRFPRNINACRMTSISVYPLV